MPWIKPVGTVNRWVSIVPVVSGVQVDFALIVTGSNEWAKWIVMDINDTNATIRTGVIAGSYPPAEVA